MNKEKKQIREVLNCLLNKRMQSLYSIISFMNGCLPMYDIKCNKVSVKDLIDDEDYRYDISIGSYVGSIWYIKTRQKQLYITEVVLD